MQTRFLGLLACCLLSLALTACGGGGGGGGSDNNTTEPPPPPPPPTPQTFSIAGTITAAGGHAVDSDTNDPARTAVGNNFIDTAQPINNPVTLGGYVNQPGTGKPGRSMEAGDIDDYFLVDLLAGQQITMLVADFEEADADLYLFDTNGVIRDLSTATGDIETVVAPEDGTYLVNAFAFAGATNYTLAIGAPSSTAVPSVQRGEIVPWEVIVEYEDTINQSATVQATGSLNTLHQSMGLTQRAGGPGRPRLMSMRQDIAINSLKSQTNIGSAAKKAAAIQSDTLYARWHTLHAIKALQNDPSVRRAEPNFRVHTTAAPNDDSFPLQWHYPLIGLPDAWEITTGSAGVIVAVVDTGVLSNHPDLQGQLVPGYDFIRSAAEAEDGNGIDSNPEDPGTEFGSGPSSFHGSHTAGTIAARGNNSVGVAGAAYSARIMPLRALAASGGGNTYDVDQAVRFAAGLANDSGTVPAQRADVINLSLGGSPFSQTSQDLYNQVRAAGIVVVAAAGNEGSSSLSYPASYAGVISVSAVDAQRRITPYSNRGSQIDVAAPGGDNSVDINGDGYPDGVLSTDGTVTASGINFVYRFLNGTSMAAPHIAGVVALMKSVNPNLTPQDIDSLLTTGDITEDLGAPGRDDLYGHGLINAQEAVLAALEATGNSPADNPRLVASNATLNFGGTGTSLELVLRNGGKGDLELANVSASEPWLQIVPLDVDSAGLGSYQINLDRSGLSGGVYSADINAQSSVNNLAVRVFMSVSGGGSADDVGVIYILLYDPETDKTVEQFVSSGNAAQYPFEFLDLPPGTYEVIAGSDADNDLQICDAGEACGAWLTIDQPILINLDSDLTDIDFPVEYQVSLPQLSALARQEGSGGNKKPRAPSAPGGHEQGVSRWPVSAVD